MKTIFEKIIDREMPADIVYEDDISMAFLTIDPTTKGHILLIPKLPFPRMQLVPDELLSDLFIRTKRLMNAMIQGLSCDLVQINVTGEEVPHFHIHLIPRKHGENLGNISPQTTYQNTEERLLVIDKIKSAL
jgi:histidine triad (HIT) family protein